MKMKKNKLKIQIKKVRLNIKEMKITLAIDQNQSRLVMIVKLLKMK